MLSSRCTRFARPCNPSTLHFNDLPLKGSILLLLIDPFQQRYAKCYAPIHLVGNRILMSSRFRCELVPNSCCQEIDRPTLIAQDGTQLTNTFENLFLGQVSVGEDEFATSCIGNIKGLRAYHTNALLPRFAHDLFIT